MLKKKAKENEIVAIAFTDYFTIDGYKRVLDYKQACRLQNILVMPNIEFRIDKIIYRSRDGSMTCPQKTEYFMIGADQDIVAQEQLSQHFFH